METRTYLEPPSLLSTPPHAGYTLESDTYGDGELQEPDSDYDDSPDDERPHHDSPSSEKSSYPRARFTEEEDELIVRYLYIHGPGSRTSEVYWVDFEEDVSVDDDDDQPQRPWRAFMKRYLRKRDYFDRRLHEYEEEQRGDSGSQQEPNGRSAMVLRSSVSSDNYFRPTKPLSAPVRSTSTRHTHPPRGASASPKDRQYIGRARIIRPYSYEELEAMAQYIVSMRSSIMTPTNTKFWKGFFFDEPRGEYAYSTYYSRYGDSIKPRVWEILEEQNAVAGVRPRNTVPRSLRSSDSEQVGFSAGHRQLTNKDKDIIVSYLVLQRDHRGVSASTFEDLVTQIANDEWGDVSLGARDRTANEWFVHYNNFKGEFDRRIGRHISVNGSQSEIDPADQRGASSPDSSVVEILSIESAVVSRRASPLVTSRDAALSPALPRLAAHGSTNARRKTIAWVDLTRSDDSRNATPPSPRDNTNNASAAATTSTQDVGNEQRPGPVSAAHDSEAGGTSESVQPRPVRVSPQTYNTTTSESEPPPRAMTSAPSPAPSSTQGLVHSRASLPVRPRTPPVPPGDISTARSKRDSRSGDSSLDSAAVERPAKRPRLSITACEDEAPPEMRPEKLGREFDFTAEMVKQMFSIARGDWEIAERVLRAMREASIRTMFELSSLHQQQILRDPRLPQINSLDDLLRSASNGFSARVVEQVLIGCRDDGGKAAAILGQMRHAALEAMIEQLELVGRSAMNEQESTG